jgi:ketosteroid isomerase-like protein
MNRRIAGFLGLSCVVLALAGAAPSVDDTTTENDKRGVAQASAEFYTALNALFNGQVEPMIAAWSHADDVTYMGPAGGMQSGWNQVLANWQAQADKKLGGTIRPENLQITVGDNLAVVNCDEVGDNELEGKPVNVNIRATTIFRKENGAWKVIGHHTDLLPFLEKLDK